MKIIIFGGTPGSGKTSIIKFIIHELKSLDIHYVKFDVLDTTDHILIKEKFNISTEMKISGDICPDHYAALEIPKVIKENQEKDLIIIETAGLCLRCSPYVKEGLAINVLNILAGKPSGYGPLLTDADVIVVSKGDLISQAEREIFRSKILKVNKNALIIDGNGLTGEGAIDVAERIKKSKKMRKQLTLKHPMPTAICGYCYGNKIVDPNESLKTYNQGKKLKAKLPNLNCGKCGFKSCNEFIRAVLDNEIKEDKCPYLNK
jgi:Ni2+-binding GTPase involved in maturation of urease and hydrogenase